MGLTLKQYNHFSIYFFHPWNLVVPVLSSGSINQFLVSISVILSIRMMVGFFILNFFMVYTSVNGGRLQNLTTLIHTFASPLNKLAHLFCV